MTGSEETAKQIEEHLQEMQDAMQEPADIHVAYTSDLSLPPFEMAGIRREREMKEQGELEKDRSNQVQTTRLLSLIHIFLVQRDKEVQMAVHEFGEGRSVYISGLPYSFENSRIL